MGREKNPSPYREHYLWKWAMRTLTSHKGRGCIISIDPGYLIEIAEHTPKCSLCGIDLDYSTGKKRVYPDTPTVDRIDNGRVLNEDSVWIVCSSCNRMKSNLPLELFLSKCETIVEYTRRNQGSNG